MLVNLYLTEKDIICFTLIFVDLMQWDGDWLDLGKMKPRWPDGTLNDWTSGGLDGYKTWWNEPL